MRLNSVQIKIIRKIIIIAVIIIVGILSLTISKTRIGTTYNNRVLMSRNEAIAKQNVYKNHQNVQKQVASQGAKSNNPIIKSIGMNNNENQKPINQISKFSKVMYNWNNKNDFNNRVKNLQKNKLISNNLTHNALFNIGKNDVKKNDIHSVLNNVSLSNQKQIGNRNTGNQTLLLNCTYTIWNNNTNTGTNVSDNNSQWMVINYNDRTNQITGIQPFYLNNNVQNSGMTTTNQTGSGVIYK